MSLMLVIWSVLVPVSGWSVVWWCLAKVSNRWETLLLSSAFAIPVGIGISSLALFFVSLLGGTLDSISMQVTCLMLGLAVFPALLAKRAASASTQVADRKSYVRDRSNEAVLLLGLLLLAVVALRHFTLELALYPSGNWDAWAIWNSRARFLSRGDELWLNFMTPGTLANHPEYPLLVPLAIAAGWKAAAAESVTWSLLIQIAFGLSTLSVAGVTLLRVSGTTSAIVFLVALLGIPVWPRMWAWQFADVPLACYVVASQALIAVAITLKAEVASKWTLWLLIGITTGLCAWTKNEGLLYCLLVMLGAAWAAIFSRPETRLPPALGFLAGIFLPLLAALTVKVISPESNDLASGQDLSSIFSRVTDVSRYKLIATAYANIIAQDHLWTIVGLLIFLVLSVPWVILKSRAWTFLPLLILNLVQLSGYTLVYVITPHDLSWHLSTSVGRVLMHIVPSLIFCFCLLIPGSVHSQSGTSTHDEQPVPAS